MSVPNMSDLFKTEADTLDSIAGSNLPRREPMRFGYTILYVNDVRESLAFYERAFDLKTKFLDDGGDFGELDTGTTALAFCSRRLLNALKKNPQPADAGAPCFEIAFVTPDVDAALAHAVDAGATLVQAPERMAWGQTVAYVADPDGFLVELCTPMDAHTGGA